MLTNAFLSFCTQCVELRGSPSLHPSCRRRNNLSSKPPPSHAVCELGRGSISARQTWACSMSLKGLFLAFVPIVPCSIGFLRLTLRLATDLAETSALAVGTSRAPGREVLLDTISRTWRTGEADPPGCYRGSARCYSGGAAGISRCDRSDLESHLDLATVR